MVFQKNSEASNFENYVFTLESTVHCYGIYLSKF